MLGQHNHEAQEARGALPLKAPAPKMAAAAPGGIKLEKAPGYPPCDPPQSRFTIHDTLSSWFWDNL